MKKSIHFLILGFLLTIIPDVARADFITVQDTISSDITWSADTVRVTGNILVWDDVTLTIEPGTRVEFQGPYYMYIHGTIIADGTVQDTIVFTPADTTGFYNDTTRDGCWDGILFYNGTGIGGPDGAMIDNDTSRFDHCRLEFTKSHPTKGLVWGAIEVTAFSRLVITNSEFRYNHSHYMGAAIRASAGSDIKIVDNYIHHNRAQDRGGGIYIHNSATIVEGNTIEHNRTTSLDWENGKGGGIGILGMNPLIRNNTIRYNSAIYGSGIYMFNCFGLIEGNTISFNSGYNNLPDLESQGGGIACYDGSTAKIFNNKLSNNQTDMGGGIFAFESDIRVFGNLIVNNTGNISGGAILGITFSGEFVNNTVAHNSSYNGGAIELEDSDPLFMNNIVWNNPDQGENQIHLIGYFANLNIQNSVIENGTSTIWGEGTYTTSELIEDDPDFGSSSGGVGAGFTGLTGNWSVSDTSPCVNAGSDDFKGMLMPPKDLAGNDRIQHTFIDIGAYEVFVPSLMVQDTIKTNTTWVADTVKVDGDVVIKDDVILTILPGTRVEFLGRYKIQVIGTLIAAGEEDNPIRFTVADTSGSWDKTIPDGSWKGVRFENDLENLNNVMSDNTPSVLRYCNFNYVKCLENEGHNIAAVYVRYFSKLYMSYCRFSDNSAYYEPASLYLYKSDVNVRNCEFYNNIANEGPAIWAETSDFTIEDCMFHDNTARVFGGAVRTVGCDLTIKDSEFTYNQSLNRGGALYMDRTKALISHCYFMNNNANHRGGAITANYENIQLLNNVIVNNTGGAGGGVYCLYSDDVLTMNNTICNNWAENGGGMYTAFANHTSVNDIFYGNDVKYDGKQYGMYSVTADINFRNTNLEGGTGGIGFWIGQELTGTYTDIIDSFPQFIRPSEGPGNIYDGTNSYWNLKSISPCINSGTLAGTALLGEFDFRGNPRVYDTLIDLGAYESQYGLPVIQSQPDNYIGCAGDTVIFRVRTRFESFYQWQKYGNDITGAIESTLKLDSITSDHDGNYKCIVSNSFGSLETNPVYLLARSAPEIIRQPEDIWAIEGEKTIISSTGIGTQPIRFQWYKDGIEIPGKTYPDLWILDTDSVDEGRYYCEVSNACRTIQSDTVQLYIAPQICMVTVDTSTGDNLVIWEKNTTAPIASYNIYRESIVAGEYDAIGNVTASSLSVYSDTGAIPAVQAYIYKITAITTDGIESDVDLCRPHKTIHLLTSLNTEYNTAQLDWDQYYGFDYGTFHIFRNGTQGGFGIIHAMASSTSTWLDVNATEGETYYYRVAVEKPVSCYPTGNEKAGTGPYHHSLSNLDDNKLKTGLDNVASGTLKIYPNPFTERTTIEFPNPELYEYRVTVRDISGKVVMTDLVSAERLVIERGDLKAGLYSIELAGKRIYRDRFIAK